MKLRNIFKIFAVLLCVFISLIFALMASGKPVPYLKDYTNNFKRNISAICTKLGITLPIETQLYLDDMATPTPKPTMIPAEYQDEIEESLGLEEQEDVAKNDGTVNLTVKEDEKTNDDDLPIPVTSAGNASFALSKKHIVYATETAYKGFSKKGDIVWDTRIQMQSPSVVVNGDYTMISETGGKKISLYKGEKHIFTTETEGSIISSDLSEKGDVVAVTDKEFYKGQVVVFNKDGKRIFAWDSGTYNILDAAISKDRHVAISLLNTDTGAASFIQCIDVNGNTKYTTENFENSLVFDLRYIGKNLLAVSESHLYEISSKGKIGWEYAFGDKTLYNYKIAPNGNTLLLFGSSSNGELLVVSSKGKAYDPIKTELMPTAIDITNNRIAYNNGRDVIISNYKGTSRLAATCSSDVQQLFAKGNKDVLCIYTSSIQIKRLEKVK